MRVRVRVWVRVRGWVRVRVGVRVRVRARPGASYGTECTRARARG